MNITIVEDERVAARRLERLCREILGDRISQVTLFANLVQAQEHIAAHPTDLLFLDLNLQGADGYELLRQAVAEPFQTIIVSANTDRAVEAFEYGVLDFIPKPYDAARLTRALERLDQTRTRREQPANVLVVRTLNRLQPVPVDSIVYLQGAGDYAEIHCNDGALHLHHKSLESLESMLPGHFVRIHKSYILDMREVVNLHIHGGGKYRVELRNGQSLPVSRTRYKEVTDRLSAQLE